MRPVHFIIGGLLFTSAAVSNPIAVTHPAFISSEKLTVHVCEDAAIIDGRFHFTSTAKKGEMGSTANVEIELPLWIPSDPKRADPATAALLTAFTAKKIYRITDENRAVWDAATAMKVTVGSHPLRIERIALRDSRSRQDRQLIPVAWQRKDYSCLLVTLEFPPEWLKGDPEIHIAYRQGLFHGRDGAEFHYVPTFTQWPDGSKTTSNLERYSMTLMNSSPSDLSFGSLTIPSGFSTILPLAHHVAITCKTPRR